MTKEKSDKLQDYTQRLVKIFKTEAENYAERLRSNDSSLTKINLAGNNITDTGVKYIAEALKVNRTLLQINLSSNKINNTGAKYIAEALKINRTLTEIDMMYNNIGNTGLGYLVEALKFNKIVTKIDISYDHIYEYLTQQMVYSHNIKQITDSLNENKQLPITFAIHHNSGNTYYSQGNMAAALAEYIKALTLQEKYLTPFHPHIINSSDNIIKAFLSMGNSADPSIILDANGTTELMIAVMCNNSEKVELLLKLEANQTDINAINKSGHTALHYAIKTMNLTLIKILIFSGADITIKNSSSQTILDLAHTECQKLNKWDFRSRIEKIIRDSKKEQAYKKLSTLTTIIKTKQRDVELVKQELRDQIKDLTEEDILENTKLNILNYLTAIDPKKSFKTTKTLKEFFQTKLKNPANLVKAKKSRNNPKNLLSKPEEDISTLIKEIDEILKSINKEFPGEDSRQFLTDQLTIIKKHYEDYIAAYKSPETSDRDYQISSKPYLHSTNPIIGKRYLKKSTAMGIFLDYESDLRSNSDSKAGPKTNTLSIPGNNSLSVPPSKYALETKSPSTTQATSVAERETSGSHPVVKLSDSKGRLLHLKESPSAPGVEYMVCSLDDIVSGRGTAPTELLKITNPRGSSSCYIASKTIIGAELSHVVEHHPEVLGMVDPQNFSEMVMLGLLTDPQDGKLDNYMAEVIFEAQDEIKGENKEGARVKSIRIVGIDNDISFADPIIRQHAGSFKGQHFVNVKNGLYFFPQMRSRIDNKFKERFLKTPPEYVIISWLKDLHLKNQEYHSLLTNGVITKEEFENLKLPIKLKPKTIETLYRKLKQIKEIFENNDYKDITHMELFKLVEKELYFYYRHISRKREKQVNDGTLTLQESISESLHDLYRAAAPSFELVHELEQGIITGNSITLTKIAKQNAEVWDFVDKRDRTIESEMENFTGLIDYSEFNEEGEKLLQTEILKLQFVTNLTLQNSESLNGDRLLKILSSRTKEESKIKTITIKGINNLTINDLGAALDHNENLTINIRLDYQKISIENLIQLAKRINVKSNRLNLIISDKIIAANNSELLNLDYLVKQNIFSPELYEYLIQNNKINNTQLNSIFHMACESGSVEMVQFFLNHDVNISKPNETNQSPLHIAASRPKTQSDNQNKIVELLLDNGANKDINQIDNEDDTALDKAIKSGNGKLAGLLLRKGAKINSLMQKYSSEDLLKTLIENNIFNEEFYDQIIAKDNLNLKDHCFTHPSVETMTFLHIAAANKDEQSLKVVDYLISRGVSIEAQDKRGITVLHIAARNSNYKMAEYLVKKLQGIYEKSEIEEGKEQQQDNETINQSSKLADFINLIDDKGYTALDKALEADKKDKTTNSEATITVLLTNGANKTKTAKDLETAKDLVIKYKRNRKVEEAITINVDSEMNSNSYPNQTPFLEHDQKTSQNQNYLLVPDVEGEEYKQQTRHESDVRPLPSTRLRAGSTELRVGSSNNHNL